jgi:hypothetical protein
MTERDLTIDRKALGEYLDQEIHKAISAAPGIRIFARLLLAFIDYENDEYAINAINMPTDKVADKAYIQSRASLKNQIEKWLSDTNTKGGVTQ